LSLFSFKHNNPKEVIPEKKDQTAHPFVRHTFRALGTECMLHFMPENSTQATQFIVQATQWVEAFEARYSRYKTDSLISKINRHAGFEWTTLTPEDEVVFGLCDSLHFLSQGIFDPTVLAVSRLWDYKANPPSVPTYHEVKSAMELVGWKKVERKPGKIHLPKVGMQLDLGGFGKEYAVDCVAEIAIQLGIDNFLIDFGHDIRVKGRAPTAPLWHIGLEDPAKPETCWNTVAITDRSIASSGDYLRYFTHNNRRYGHIVDPRTGYPVPVDGASVTIIASTCLEAGLYATTAFILGPEHGLPLIEAAYNTEGCINLPPKIFKSSRFYESLIN
jgi:thiamine biosynthesis lipoprotein